MSIRARAMSPDRSARVQVPRSRGQMAPVRPRRGRRTRTGRQPTATPAPPDSRSTWLAPLLLPRRRLGDEELVLDREDAAHFARLHFRDDLVTLAVHHAIQRRVAVADDDVNGVETERLVHAAKPPCLVELTPRTQLTAGGIA